VLLVEHDLDAIKVADHIVERAKQSLTSPYI
jgi:excinuclease UvrABC ATPase subunit